MTAPSDLLTLPEGWVWTRLGEVAEINPRFIGKDIPDDIEITFLPMRCVEELTGHTDLSFTRRVSEVKKGYTPFQDNDLLFAKITPCMENGKVTIVYGLKNGIGFGSTEFHVIRLYESLPRKLFFFFLIREELRKDAQRNMTGSAGQLRVPVNYIRQILIPFPPLPEQHRIVAKIEELFTKLDAGIESLKTVSSQLKRYRQAILKYAFEGNLTEQWRERHKDELEPASVLLERIKEERKKTLKGKYKELPPLDTSDLSELPEGWVWARVGEIGHIISGQTPKGINNYGSDGEIPYFKVGDMNKSGNEKHMFYSDIALDLVEIEKLGLRIQDKGTVIFPKRGGAIGTNKKRILAQPSAYDLNIMGVHTLIIPYFFYYYWILSIDLITLSDGSNVPQINHKDIEPLTFPLPHLSEQHKIVEEIERRFSVADKVERTVKQTLKQSERLHQSILKKAFEGKLVPQDPTDEPASVLLERIKVEREKREIEAKSKSKNKRKRDLVQKQRRFNDYVK